MKLLFFPISHLRSETDSTGTVGRLSYTFFVHRIVKYPLQIGLM
jgi:hypothetical protein